MGQMFLIILILFLLVIPNALSVKYTRVVSSSSDEEEKQVCPTSTNEVGTEVQRGTKRNAENSGRNSMERNRKQLKSEIGTFRGEWKRNSVWDEGTSQTRREASQKHDASVTEAEPIIKKTRNPISAIRLGESMINIELTIVEENAIYITKEQHEKVWSLVGSDGVGFITISIWGNFSRDLRRQMGTNFLNKNFRFSNFSAKHVQNEWNLGTVDLQLVANKDATITQVGKALSTTMDYYEFLKKKHALDASFKPLPFPNEYVAGRFDFKATFVKVNPIRAIYPNAMAEESYVMGIMLEDGNEKVAWVNGWNIYARFLKSLLYGREGATIKIHNVYSKKNKANEFVFTWKSKISVEDQDKVVPTSLRDLIGKRGNEVQMDLRLKIAQYQCGRDDDGDLRGTMCYDGKHKTQFVFPRTSRFKLGEEFTLKLAEVEWNDAGVLTLTIGDEAMSIKRRHWHQEIPETKLSDLDYPGDESD